MRYLGVKDGDYTTVFLSSAGATNAVNVMNALEESGKRYRIIAGDMNPVSAGLFLADKGFVIPPVKDPDFIFKVFEICQEEAVDVALPIYSADFPIFRTHIDTFAAGGIKTYAPPAKALEITSDKYKVCEFLNSIGITAPRTWRLSELHQPLPFPLFMKRISGSGSRDTAIIPDRTALKFHASPDFIYQEYIEGDEFTIDVISDLNGKMIGASPRKRDRIYGGLSVTGTTVEDAEIVRETQAIVEALQLPGPSNVQCKRDGEGDLYFYDINPRFASGGLPLAVAAGMNIPEILIDLLLGKEVPERIYAKPGVTMIRYWNSLIIKTAIL
jgi:carbamoyl-phosphate synthase large subunit